MLFVGIDNGLAGGIVAINEQGSIVLKAIMPVITGKKSRREYDIVEIKKILLEIKVKADEQQTIMVVGVEKAQVSPVISKLSAFSMGFCLGMLQGLLSALNISYMVFRAAEWQKVILTGMSGENTKVKSILWCKRKYPDTDWKKTERCQNDSDGLTDACCIANYLRMIEGGK